nr:putative ribonuclease H-like domain-containing protein [Tanacetum cinerariifolium]
LNEVKSTIVTLQRVVKHRMTLETHNWSSSAHQELHKIVRDENFPIVNQVDARVQNFEIQFLKEAAKFVGDFKSLAKEAYESLAKHKALELEIECLLRAVVSQDIMSVVQKTSVVDTSNLQTELERTKERFENCIIKKENEYTKLWNDCVSDILNPLSQKLENENVELEFQVLNYAREKNAHRKSTYKNLFDSISVSRTQTKTIVASLQKQLHNSIYENAKLRAQLFNKVSDQKDNKSGISANTKFVKQSIMENLPKSSQSKNKDAEVEEHHRNLLLAKNKKHMSSACNNLDSQNVISKVVSAMCKQCLISVNHDVCLRNYVNGKNSHGKKHKANVSIKEKQKKHQPKVKKPKTVGFIERLAKPKPSKPRFLFRWSPTGRLFDQKGNIVDSSESESQSDCSNGDNACTSNTLEPKIKWFPNSTSLLGRLSRFVYGTVRFGNDHVAAILGFGDLQWGNILINRVYFVEGLGHNLFSVGQFCDSNLETITRKRYVLVIVDDYSRYTWVHFIRSKDEAPEVIKTFLKRITVLLQSPVIIIRTDNGTKFKNHVLKEYFDSVGISHQMSSVRTPQQNGVVKRRNRPLVEAARTILIFSRAPLFLWAEAIATACFTQNRSIIHRRFNKTPYELVNGKKPNISFLHVFSALCYPKNDREDIGKLGAKAMAFEQHSSKPRLQSMTSGQISSGLDLTYAPSTITTQQPSEGELDLLFEAMYDDYIGGQPSATARTILAAQEPQACQTLTASTSIVDSAPTPTNSSSLATNVPNTSQDVDELNLQQQHAQQQGIQAHL